MFDLSVPQKMAMHRESWEYNQYLNLVKAMGKQVTVDYNIEGLAMAQAAMKRVRQVQAFKDMRVQSDEGEMVEWADLFKPKVTGMDFDVYSQPLGAITSLHPTFLFAHHARGFDHGRNQIVDLPVRGDSLSVPVVSENGREVYYVSMAFHKGDFHVFFTYFPERPDDVREKLAEILDTYETR